MFTKKQTKQVLALSMVVAAFSMLFVFLFVSIRKKSLTKALLAVAAMEGAIGTFLLWQESFEERRAALPRFGFDGPNNELFDDEEIDAVENHMDEVLGGYAADREPAGKPIFTIPVDEEACEADFLN